LTRKVVGVPGRSFLLCAGFHRRPSQKEFTGYPERQFIFVEFQEAIDQVTAALSIQK
jgi:hypothetical protein